MTNATLQQLATEEASAYTTTYLPTADAKTMEALYGTLLWAEDYDYEMCNGYDSEGDYQDYQGEMSQKWLNGKWTWEDLGSYGLCEEDSADYALNDDTLDMLNAALEMAGATN